MVTDALELIGVGGSPKADLDEDDKDEKAEAVEEDDAVLACLGRGDGDFVLTGLVGRLALHSCVGLSVCSDGRGLRTRSLTLSAVFSTGFERSLVTTFRTAGSEEAVSCGSDKLLSKVLLRFSRSSAGGLYFGKLC